MVDKGQERFLRGLGLQVGEDVVEKVVAVLRSAKPSLYQLYASTPPTCAKGTAYKIKKLYIEGTLGPYLEYHKDPRMLSEQQETGQPLAAQDSSPPGITFSPATEVAAEFAIWEKKEGIREIVDGLLSNLDLADHAFHVSGFDMEAWDTRKEHLAKVLGDFCLHRLGSAQLEKEFVALSGLIDQTDAKLADLFRQYHKGWPDFQPLDQGQPRPRPTWEGPFITLQIRATPLCQVPADVRPGPCREGARPCPLLDAESHKAEQLAFFSRSVSQS